MDILPIYELVWVISINDRNLLITEVLPLVTKKYLLLIGLPSIWPSLLFALNALFLFLLVRVFCGLLNLLKVVSLVLFSLFLSIYLLALGDVIQTLGTT